MIKKIYKQLIVSQILSQLAVTICMLIDSIMIGSYLGVDSLAAYGFANPVLIVFTAIGGLLSCGIQVACSGYVGRGDKESINKIYSSAIAICIGISIICMSLIFIFKAPLATLLGAKPGTASFEYTKQYLVGFIIGIPALIGSLIMMPLLQISGKKNVLIIAVSVMSFFDILFDYLNVKVGLFGGGIFGMGLASSLSYISALIVGLFYFLRKDCPYKFSFSKIKLKFIGEIISDGTPTIVNQLCVTVLTLITNNILSNISSDSAYCVAVVAANSVICTVANILYSFGAGASSITITLGAIFYEEKDRQSLADILRIGTKISFTINLVVFVIVECLAKFFVSLFIQADAGADAFYITKIGLRIYLFVVLINSITAVYRGYFQGVRNFKMVELISLMQNLVLTGGLAFILSQTGLGAYGVWLGTVCGEILTLTVFFAIVSIKNKKLTISPEACTLLPDDFGVVEDSCIACSVIDMDSAISASSKIKDFCVERGKSERDANFIALAVEEMTVNIVKHGFSKNDINLVDVKFIHDGDDWILRIRDNCESFDPIDYMQLHESDDPFAHIGIRTVSKIAKNASYTNSLGMNNLVLEF